MNSHPLVNRAANIVAATAAPPLTTVAPPIQFEDLYSSYDATGGYIVTNEEPDIHRELLSPCKGLKKVGSIASGGEVPLFVFLSRGSRVYAVDHCYKALASAYLKARMLQQLGGEGTRDILAPPTVDAYNTTTPDLLRIKEFIKTLADVPEPLLKILTYSTFSFDGVRREWGLCSPNLLEKTVRHLSKLTLIHGDLGDLKKYAPLDCLYISNALEHSGRAGTPKTADLASLLKPGGLLLTTGNAKPANTEFTLVKEIRGYRTSWVHSLFKRNKEIH